MKSAKLQSIIRQIILKGRNSYIRITYSKVSRQDKLGTKVKIISCRY